MLHTPFGQVQVILNGTSVDYEMKELPNTLLWPDVNERYLIEVTHEEVATICCVVANDELAGEVESGENLEAISFYKEDLKLTIGTCADFPTTPGRYLANGIERTAAQKLLFCIYWIQPCTKDNDMQTWFGADPFHIGCDI